MCALRVHENFTTAFCDDFFGLSLETELHGVFIVSDCGQKSTLIWQCQTVHPEKNHLTISLSFLQLKTVIQASHWTVNQMKHVFGSVDIPDCPMPCPHDERLPWAKSETDFQTNNGSEESIKSSNISRGVVTLKRLQASKSVDEAATSHSMKN